MTEMKIRICAKCGQDCSDRYAEFLGRPYHFGCLPTKDERTVMAREWVATQRAGA